MNPSDIALAREWASFYRTRGYNVLPSRPDEKRPYCTFADLWDSPAPASLFDRWPTTNIQIMTGRHWGLLVIDLDGHEAQVLWNSMGWMPRTWITHSGGGGRHLWFRIERVGPPIRKAFVWKGSEGHAAIERLCDKSLIMAPPSIHPTTGRRYQFLNLDHSPARLSLPAECPRWILELRTIDRPAVGRMTKLSRMHLTEITDKLSLARSWGLRLVGKPNGRGWVPCHAIDREDVHPSAAIHRDTGFYVDQGSGERLGFYALAVRLGIYLDTKEAHRSLIRDRVNHR